MNVMHRTTAVVLLALLGLSACSGGDDPSVGAASPSVSPIRSTATIRITSPQQGAVVDADSIPIKIDLEGGRIADKASNDPADNRPDLGHMHVVLDNVTVSFLEGKSFDLVEVLKREGKSPIAKGRHVLQAEFATVSHGFFSPRVLSTVTFTVR